MAVGAFGQGAEIIDRRQRAGCREPKDRTVVVGPALGSCAVEISVRRLNKTVRSSAVGTPGFAAEDMEGRERAARSDFESGGIRGPVETSAEGLNGARIREFAARARV